MNINLWYKKNTTRFENLFQHLNKTENLEEKARIYLAGNILLCFSIGMFYNCIEKVFSEVPLLFAFNLTSLIAAALVTILYICRKITNYVALVSLLFAVQINISFTIFLNYTSISEQSRFMISHNLFFSFLVCLLAGVSIQKRKVYLLCTLPLIALTAALIIKPSEQMMKDFIFFCLAFISPPILLTYIRIFLWDTYRKKEQLSSEKKNFCQLMDINEKELNILIEVLQNPQMPQQQFENLFSQMQQAIGSKLMTQVTQLFGCEGVMERINEKHKFALTVNEIRLCYLILEDKSITEISRMLYINESSVRANRSRIRKKMKMDKKTNLKVYLRMLIIEEKKISTDFEKSSTKYENTPYFYRNKSVV